MKWISLTCISIIIISCSPDPVDVSNVIQPQIRKNWDQFITAWESEDAKTCASLYTINGINTPPEIDENKGRNAVETFYKFLFDNNLSSNYTHTILDLDGDQNHLIEYGKFSVDWVTNDSTEWTYNARSMTHWVNEEGVWKIKKFLFNNPPGEE